MSAKEAKLNPKAFYAYARSKLKTKEGIPDLEDEHGKLTTHDTGKADLLNKLFCSVFTTEDTNIIPNFIDRTIANTLTDISYKQINSKDLK